MEEKDKIQSLSLMPGRRSARKVERNVSSENRPDAIRGAEKKRVVNIYNLLENAKSEKKEEIIEVEDSVVTKEPIGTEESTGSEESTVSEESAVSEESTVSEESVVPEESAATEVPVLTEATAVSEEISKVSSPVIEDIEQIKETVSEETTEIVTDTQPVIQTKKSSGLSKKVLGILIAVVVFVAAIVFGIVFLAGKEQKESINYMDQLRTQEIVPCEMETVNQFFADYYASLSAGNTTDLEKMFDNPEKANVSAGVSTIVEQYSNLSVHITEGIQKNEYVVFVYNEVKFKNIKTVAPSVDCYYIICSETDESIKIKTDMYTDPEIIRFVTLASYMEPMRSLLANTDSELTKALNSDKELKNLYIVMQSMTDAVLNSETTEQ